MSAAPAEVAARLAAVRARIERACRDAGRDPREVALLAVSKGQSADAVRAAYDAGQRAFGENYVQELADKQRQLGELPGLELRFIGRLQRNKVKELCRLTSLSAVDCVDSVALADELERRAAERPSPLPVLIQLNVDAEAQKAGVALAELPALCAHVRALSALRLDGLMAIPAAESGADATRRAFATVREHAARHGLRVLSIGMSGDLELAIAEGATLVRVGTAIFGERARRDSGP